jgi:hypothetical protein
MQRTIDNSTARRLASSLLLPALLTFCVAATMTGQSFPSGSTGADGALNITAAGVTNYTTKPVGGGNVYNFTTINIAVGSTLKLSGSVFPLPLYFLATGAVTISGTIDLTGQDGVAGGTSGALSSELIGPTTPGPGGYGGGSAGYQGGAAGAGLGPLGGSPGVCASGGGFSGNQYLVPLVGGSGGGGSQGSGGAGVGSGGAGGGALLIASSVSITVLGTITTNGGAATGYSGTGAGGGVRLVAPTLAGNGSITAAHGTAATCGGGNNGVIRMEAFTNSFSGTTVGTLYLATPFNLFTPAPTALPSIMVTSIGGVAVPASPTGSFTVPDVSLNSSSPLTINIQATNIPAGTTATVYFDTESNPSQAIVSTALAATGTPGVTTATATVTLKSGYSKGFVVATWTQ